jgi:hypothetical protein
MPTNKDFKRLVRARMQKTGEAYTAARANLLRKPVTAAAASRLQPTDTPPARPPIDYAKLAGISDAAVMKGTGCTWEKWVYALDGAGAGTWSHRAIAEHVQTSYNVAAWWAQTVTVGYERIKGLREIGQRRDGGYEATKTKTIDAGAPVVFRAFADARVRRAWLPGVKVTVRKATPSRSVRMTWDDGTSVEVWLTPKGARKTAAQVQHRQLAGKEDAERRRRYWDERLSALRGVIERRADRHTAS